MYIRNHFGSMRVQALGALALHRPSHINVDEGLRDKVNMSMKICALVGAVLSCTTVASNQAHQLDLSSASSSNTKAMEQVFLRSEETHAQSMASILKDMSPTKAVEVLEKSSLATPQLVQAANIALGKESSFRKQPKGYSGLDGARKLLNDMIYESMSKYDAEIAKCTEYYSKQCAAMEACRGQI